MTTKNHLFFKVHNTCANIRHVTYTKTFVEQTFFDEDLNCQINNIC